MATNKGQVTEACTSYTYVRLSKESQRVEIRMHRGDLEVALGPTPKPKHIRSGPLYVHRREPTLQWA